MEVKRLPGLLRSREVANVGGVECSAEETHPETRKIWGTFRKASPRTTGLLAASRKRPRTARA